MAATTPAPEAADWEGADVRTESVNPLVTDFTDLATVPATILDVVLAGSPGRGDPSGAPVAVTSLAPATGLAAGGATVTFTGSGFDGEAISVTFGGVAATAVNVVSDTSFTAVTPAHAAGAVPVVVQPGAITVPGGFTYT